MTDKVREAFDVWRVDAEEWADDSYHDQMFRCYKAGRESMREEAIEACEKQNTYDEDDPGETFSNVIKELP